MGASRFRLPAMIEALSVVTLCTLAAISPGADFAMVTRNSLLRSRRAGVLTALGIALALLLHVSYTLAGIGLLIAHSPLLFNLIRYAGAAYLVCLGVKMLRSTPRAVAGDAPAAALSDFAALRTGFLSNLLNPKAPLFTVALFTQVIGPATPLPAQLAAGAFLSLIHLLWFSLVACVFSSEPAQRVFGRSRVILERSLGVLLAAFGLGLAVMAQPV